jgi:hypothetical protein
METERILAELLGERERIDQAITALESLSSDARNTTVTRIGGIRAAQTAPKPARRRRMSAAGRKRISEAAKAMWAQRRKKANTTRHMSAATRKRLSELAKQRWAQRKKKAKTA